MNISIFKLQRFESYTLYKQRKQWTKHEYQMQHTNNKICEQKRKQRLTVFSISFSFLN